MTELPILVETSAWLSLSFGAILIAVSLTLARRFISDRPDDAGADFLFNGIAMILTFGLGCALAVQNIDWQFRIEENGFVLQAPFDLMNPSEEISWPDIEEVSVLESSYRGGATFKLIIVSKRGKKITVSVADKFPAQFGPLLQKVVAERAPQAKDIQRIAENIDYARTNSDSLLAARYTVRNARGEVLK